jgi:hypothetical protein
MMLAPYDDERLYVVMQVDHSRLAGYLAAHWGNDTFARPTPYASLALAAGEHDNGGWWGVELKPYLDAEGYPLDYLDTIGHLGPIWLESWGEGVERIAAHDAYAALMICTHGIGILSQGFGLLTRIRNYAEDPRVAAFVREQEARRAALLADVRADRTLRDAATDEHLWANYRLMEAYDQLSQILCSRYPLNSTARQRGPSRTLSDVPMPVAPGQPDTIVTIDPLDERRAVLAPYPFDVNPLEVVVNARLLPRRRFADRDDYQAELLRAPRLSTTYTLHAA